MIDGYDKWYHSRKILIPLERPCPAVTNIWSNKFTGWWRMEFEGLQLNFQANKGSIILNGKTIKLVCSDKVAFPATQGWFMFSWDGCQYFTNIVKHQCYKFTQRPNAACQRSYNGVSNYCGNGKMITGKGWFDIDI